MTVQEQQMIDGLVERIRNTPVAAKDADAEQRLQQGLAGYPDAVYVMAQTILVQQYGLQQAQAQIQALQEQLQQAQSHAGGSFLSHLFGGSQAQPPSQASAGQSQVPYQPVNPSGYPPQPSGYPPQGYAAPYPPVYAQPGGFGGGGFLQGALQTAAGVAAGEMMFQGMESLFHGFGGGGGFGGGYGEGRPTEVVNNYYGDEGGRRETGAGDSSFYNPEHDASRQDLSDTGASGFADTADAGNADVQDDSNDFVDNGSGDSDFGSGDDGSMGGDDSGF